MMVKGRVKFRKENQLCHGMGVFTRSLLSCLILVLFLDFYFS
jgi:hypothetical protein